VSEIIAGVRLLAERDVAQVLALAAAVPTAPHWPAFEFYRMLQVIADQPERRGAWVWCDREHVQGFAMASHTAGTAELEAVVTASTHRRRGIGQALVGTVAAWARELAAERLLLEVRASNRDARRLYALHGFQQDGIRHGYYRSPEEDAVLLSLAL
jgi:ribosomal-protein-alanine N-acetyltransferase